MKYLKIGLIILGVFAFLNMSINAYYGNYVRFYNVEFSSLVIWVYFPLAFFSTLKAWLTFSAIELADKKKISENDKKKYFVVIATIPIMLSFFIEDFKNYDAILYNGWNGLLFYPSFLSNLFLVIYYLVLKHKPKSRGNNADSVDAKNDLSIIR